MSITLAPDEEENVVYISVPPDLRAEMHRVFQSVINTAEQHLANAVRNGEPLSFNFSSAVQAVVSASKSLAENGEIPFIGGNNPGEDATRKNPFTLALLSAYGFSQTPHKNINPHSLKGFESLQPLANLMHRHCIYT